MDKAIIGVVFLNVVVLVVAISVLSEAMQILKKHKQTK